MDRPDLLFPFDHATCPRCLASPLRQPVGPTVCPACDTDISVPVGWPIGHPTTPSHRPDPYWDRLVGQLALEQAYGH